jgi:hypothetical protein
MSKYLLYIDTALVVNEQFSQFIKNNIRRQQIIFGLRKLFEYDFAAKGCDVLFTDNTITELDEEIKSLFPPNTIFRCFQHNPYGHLNKGAGLLQKWIHNKDILDRYEYIIHFESRLALQSHSFFDTFFSNPRTLFRNGSSEKTDNKTAFTGLFSCKPSLLWACLEKYPIPYLIQNAISIELAIRPYLMREENSEIETLDLVWYCFDGTIQLF